MSQNNSSMFCLDPIVQTNKYFVFKNKKIPIDFDLIKTYSLYFKKNQNKFESQTDIEITEEIDISNDEFQAFVDCCQKRNFQITDSNAFALHYLSINYEVPGLTKFTENYVETNYQKLIFPSLLFKQKNQLSTKYQFKNSHLIFNESKEEEIIADHLDEYISDERLLSLEIPVINRILTIYFQKKENNGKNSIADFLIKYLKHHGKEASVIFTNIDLGNFDHEIIIRLHNECKDVFDFNMINSESLFKTTYDLLGELKSAKFEIEKITQVYKEQSTAFNNCKSEFNSQMNQIREEAKRMKERLDGFESKQIQFEKNQTNLESKQTQFEKNQTNLESKQTQFEKNQTNLERKQTQFEKNQTNLESKQTQFEKNQTNLISKQTQFEKNQTNLISKQTQFEKNQTNFERKQTQLENNQTNLESKQTLFEKNQTNLISKQTQFEKNQTNFESKQTQFEKNQTNFESKQNAFEEKQKNYEKANQTISQQYQQLLSRQNELSQQLLRQQQNNKSFQESLDQINKEISAIKIPFTGNNEFTGIISYLRQNSKENIEKVINVTSSSIFENNQDFNPIKAVLFEETTKDFGSNDEKNSWLCIDFKEHRIVPKHYTIRSGRNFSDRPRSWVIECSNDNDKWDILDEEINNQVFNGSRVSHTFKMNRQVTKKYRYIRMRNTGPDSNGNNFLFINSIEFYGSLI